MHENEPVGTIVTEDYDETEDRVARIKTGDNEWVSVYTGTAYKKTLVRTETTDSTAWGVVVARPNVGPTPAEELAQVLYPSMAQMPPETQKNQVLIAQRAIDAGYGKVDA